MAPPKRSQKPDDTDDNDNYDNPNWDANDRNLMLYLTKLRRWLPKQHKQFKVVSATFYRAIVGDGGSLRSSRRRRSRVRAAHATCAACIRALPARLHRRGKAC